MSAPSKEQKFLDWFGQNFNGNALNSKFSFGSLTSNCTSFSEIYRGESLGGHGHSPDPTLSTLKAAAELVERRAVLDFYQKHPAPIRSTNGWAVHLTADDARNSAKREALERHILLYTFLKSGWSEFVFIDHRAEKEGEAWFLLSPFIQNGFAAGIVVYKSEKFPGVSFGHFSDVHSQVKSSDRWNHALFEAVGFSERIAETGGLKAYGDSIYKTGGYWLEKAWDSPRWSSDYAPVTLPEVSLQFSSHSLANGSGLYISHCQGERLLPLFLLEDVLDSEKVEIIKRKLIAWGLELPKEKMPIL